MFGQVARSVSNQPHRRLCHDEQKKKKKTQSKIAESKQSQASSLHVAEGGTFRQK